MGECLITTEMKYEEGFIHYVKKDEKGNISVWRAKMARGGKHKKDETKSK